jgi:hypothetical protein
MNFGAIRSEISGLDFLLPFLISPHYPFFLHQNLSPSTRPASRLPPHITPRLSSPPSPNPPRRRGQARVRRPVVALTGPSQPALARLQLWPSPRAVSCHHRCRPLPCPNADPSAVFLCLTSPPRPDARPSFYGRR